jgi:hypothetical protein
LRDDAGHVLRAREADTSVEVPRGGDQDGRGDDIAVERKDNWMSPVLADELRQNVVHRDVAVQVGFESKGLKPGNHFALALSLSLEEEEEEEREEEEGTVIGSRVETTCFQKL